MNIRNIMEELKDIPRTNKIYHRTNIENLEQILKTGGLKSSSCYGDKKNSICFGRKSVFNKIDSGELKSGKLSNGIGLVEFMIFEDRLGNNKLRGVKKEKISEFSKKSLDYVKERIKDVYPNSNTNEILREISKQASKEISKMVKESNSKNFTKNDIPSKLLTKYSGFTEDELKLIIINLAIAKGYATKDRESEERLTNNKKEFTIPLDSELMSIKLLPGAFNKIIRKTDDKVRVISKHDAVQIRRTLSLIKENSKLFLKNDEFKKCVRYYNKEIKNDNKRN